MLRALTKTPRSPQPCAWRAARVQSFWRSTPDCVGDAVDVAGRAADVENQAVAERFGEQLCPAQHRARRRQDAQCVSSPSRPCPGVNDVAVEELVDQAADRLDVEHVHVRKTLSATRVSIPADSKILRTGPRMAELPAIQHRHTQLQGGQALGVAQDDLLLAEIDPPASRIMFGWIARISSRSKSLKRPP